MAARGRGRGRGVVIWPESSPSAQLQRKLPPSYFQPDTSSAAAKDDTVQDKERPGCLAMAQPKTLAPAKSDYFLHAQDKPIQNKMATMHHSRVGFVEVVCSDDVSTPYWNGNVQRETVDPFVEEFAGLLISEVYSHLEYDYEDPKSHPVPLMKVVPFLPVVKVDHVEGPDNFFIKFNQNKGETSFAVFQAKLSHWYDSNAMSEPNLQPHHLVKGGHYVALSQLDEKWHRVVVLSWDAKYTVRVQLLDDGRIMLLPLKNLQYIRKVFSQAPMQALHATAQMVKGHIWTEEERVQFKGEVEGREVNVIMIKEKMVTEFLPFPTVDVVLMQSNTYPQKMYDFGNRLKCGYTFGYPKNS